MASAGRVGSAAECRGYAAHFLVSYWGKLHRQMDKQVALNRAAVFNALPRVRNMLQDVGRFESNGALSLKEYTMARFHAKNMELMEIT